MDQRTIGIYLSRILSGFYLFLYKNKRYKLVYPDINIKYEAEIYAEQEYEYNKFNDWLTEDNIVDTLVNLGMWDYSGDNQLKNLEKQMDDIKVDLYQNFLNPNKIKSLRRNLANVKHTYNQLFEIRHSFDHITAQGFASIIKNHYILMHSLFNEHNKLLFTSLNDIDIKTFEIFSNIIAQNTISIESYRKIARSDIWRNYWSANSDNLFDKSTVNWTDEQKTLVVLTRMYDSAYQHPECPQDNVFEDDDMFDGWMIFQRRENEKAKNKIRTEKLLEGKNLDKAGEIFVMAHSKQEAQNIYDLNDNTSKYIIKERNDVIKQRGGLTQDTDLPDVHRQIISMSNEQFKNSR